MALLVPSTGPSPAECEYLSDDSDADWARDHAGEYEYEYGTGE